MDLSISGSVNVGDGKDFFFPRLKPFFFGEVLAFGAVSIPAGVVRDSYVAAGIAYIDMTAKCGTSAYLNGVHRPQVLRWYDPIMRLSIVRATVTKDRGNFHGASHGMVPPRGLSYFFSDSIPYPFSFL